MKWIAVALLVTLVACSGDLSQFVKKSEIIQILQAADIKLSAKFDQVDKTLKRLERQIKRRKSEEN